jgi:iron complex outermembrane recepter protein
VGDRAALRITAYHNELAGWIDAIQPGLSVKKDVNGGSRTGVRVAMRIEPNEKLVVTPRIIYQEVETDGWNRRDALQHPRQSLHHHEPAVTFGERAVHQIGEPFTDEFLLADLNIEYDFGEVKLTSITSYTDRDVLVVRDATALTASITGGTIALPENGLHARRAALRRHDRGGVHAGAAARRARGTGSTGLRACSTVRWSATTARACR